MPQALRMLGEPEAPATPVGPAIAAKGFRPFFLLAGLFAAAIVPIWLLALLGVVEPRGYLDATTWHAHEMVHGFAVAVIAGFLLTAVGNWTSRETLVGKPLLLLAGLWVLGRVALAAGTKLPPALIAAVDLAFLPALAVAIGRPLVATHNRRNYVMLGVVGALFVANLLVHLDALGVVSGWRRRGGLLAVDVVVLVIVVMAGRIFPMFTRNATKVESIRNVPALDAAAAAAMALLVVADALVPDVTTGAVIAAAASGLTLARAARWGTRHTFRIPLLWILHVGYAWIPVGLALRAISAFSPVVPSAVATHALTVGAIGGLTLGMMARVSLGHTGRPLVASRAATASFVLVTLAAFVRVVVPLVRSAAYRESLLVAGTLFSLAFAIYAASYFSILTSPRIDGKPG